MRPSLKLALLAIASVLALGLALPARAGVLPVTITITKTAIENVDGNGCSLYEALQAIFSNVAYHECPAGSDINLIVFGGAAIGGTITFPAKPNDLDLPMINKNVTITGPVVIDGNGANTDQHIFRIAPGGTLNLANMVIKNAHTSGGGAAVLDNNGGSLNVIGVSFNSNVAEGDGGAINANGSVNILSSNFVGNKAQGIYPNKSNNPATGYGGAINISGSDKLKLALSNFSGNVADKGGGALFYSGNAAEVSDVIFSGNIVNGTGSDSTAPQGGGAILNDSDAALMVIRNAFSGNLTPTSSGGAIYTRISATAVISETSFQGNIAASPGNSAAGGAIYNAGANVTLLQDTFLNNAVVLGNGGAVANDRHGTLLAANSSFTANAAAGGDGGAIHNTNTQQGGPVSTVVAKNVTFSSNAALNSSGHGGAIFNDQGHSLTLGNTIVDNSVGDNCTGTITSLGHNLDSVNTCGFNQAGDKANADPKLDTPSFNGGPLVSLLTQKLLAGSDAIDKGDPAICSAYPVNNVDQRGDARPKGATCDIGSFESEPFVAGYGSTPVQPGPIALGNATANGVDTVDAIFTIYETGNATLTVSNPQFGGANAGDFSVKSPAFPLNIPDGGADQTVTLSCKPGAVGPRAGTLTLTTNDPAHSSVTYNLTCNGTSVPATSFSSDPVAPGPIDFGEVTVNTTASSTIVVKNTGDADLHVSNPVLGGANPADFKVPTAFPLPAIVPNATQNIQVQCQPVDLNIRTATLTLTTDDQNRQTVVFNLACQSMPVPPPILGVPGESVSYPLPSGATYGPYGVATSADGLNVYAADLINDRLIVFARDTTTGNISVKQTVINNAGGVSGMDGPYLVTISPDGQNVYVTGSASNSVVTFKRDPTDGTLSFVKKVTKGDPYFCLPVCNQLQALTAAYQVTISPDGKYGYVSSFGDNLVTVLDRNATTGALELSLTGPVQLFNTNLSQAYGLALSPDGANLYVTGYLSNTLEVLKRDPVNGTLSFVEQHIDGQAGVDGLSGVFRVTVSPDGAYVYTASFGGSAVTAFKRDQLSGKLTFVATYKDGVGGVDGLSIGTSVAVSPDGKRLFATGYSDAAVAVFDRDPATGLLVEKQVIKRDAGSGLPALNGARDVAVSPDGRTVYATGFLDKQVVALHMANPTPVLQSLAPASAQAGGAAFKLTVNGQDFMPGSKVRWDGADRPTTFVNNTELTAQIGAADIAAAGSASVTVFNPAPGGGTSNALSFTITAPGQNPVPSIETLAPASAPAGGAGFTLAVNGANFIASSRVRWNGVDRTTSFVDSTRLTIQVGAADIAQPGPVGVTVFNPGPGGGISNAVTFEIAAPGENPTPSIDRISPTQVMADVTSATAITLIVSGANFIAGSQARWNGSLRSTTFVGATQLKMTVTSADIALGGQGSVTVFNPGPGGGTSNTATFTVIPIRSRVYLPLVRR